MSDRIAIIGAGIAGLACAAKLYANGFKDIVVLEATKRIGGRIHTISFENGVLELGAQWLHGQHGNPLYTIAKERDLLSNPQLDFGEEGQGIFCTDSGQLLNEEIVNQIVSFLDQIKDDMSENCLNKSYAPNEIVSVEQIFRDYFKEYINSEKCPLTETDLLWALFNWYIKFEIIDNSCNDLNDISLLSYTEWYDCDGVKLINFKGGYQTLIDSLVNEIPRHLIVLEKPVERIEVHDQVPNVKLLIEGEKSELLVNHLVITCSLGFMKKNMDTFFGFPLPYDKINVIESLGFGTIDKIFLYFDQPFWTSKDKGFQLLWTKKHHSLPEWVYDISGFDLVRGQPNVLVAWIGGNGAKEMEKVDSDQLVGIICANVLRLFLPQLRIENPSKVVRSKWSSNKYVCGAYSNRSIEYQQKKCDIQCLSDPIFMSKHSNSLNGSIDWPLVLFAGEATDREFYSTTHGAMRSGYREADRIINFRKTLGNLKPNL